MHTHIYACAHICMHTHTLYVWLAVGISPLPFLLTLLLFVDGELSASCMMLICLLPTSSNYEELVRCLVNLVDQEKL